MTEKFPRHDRRIHVADGPSRNPLLKDRQVIPEGHTLSLDGKIEPPQRAQKIATSGRPQRR